MRWHLAFGCIAATVMVRAQAPDTESPAQIHVRIALGQKVGEDLEKRDGRISTPAIVDYLQGIENRLASAAAVRPAEVRITRSSKLYANRLPNGVLYISAGLLKRVDNEAELAGLLAHQVVHAKAAPQTAGIAIPPDCIMANAPSPGSMKNRRAVEMEASDGAVAILKSSGYEPNAMLDLLSRVAYDHPGWGKAIDLDDLLSIRAKIDSDVPPQIGYRVDSSQFVKVRENLAAEVSPKK